MPLIYIKGDITKINVDAIVNAANSSLLGGGGVDGAIHRAAGEELLFECRLLGGCKTGQAKITKGYKLPAKHVIHTVGPVWRGGDNGERELLYSCYKNSLALAKENGCESVAFPLISSGIYGYPKAEAMQVAVEAIKEFLQDNDMLIYIVLFGDNALKLDDRLYAGVNSYIKSTYTPPAPPLAAAQAVGAKPAVPGSSFKSILFKQKKAKPAPPDGGAKASVTAEEVCDEEAEVCFGAAADLSVSLDERLKYLDESFSQMLLRLIDEKGMTDAQCYKKANIDRKLFSKIRSDISYHPKKPTAVAFAIALELPMPQARELIEKAGYSLTHTNKFDIIIEYFITNGRYDVFEINEALFAFDQCLIG